MVDDEPALVVKLHGIHSVLRLGTQPENLPHAALHLDLVPSLSSDSRVRLAQALTHRCSELAKWFCLSGMRTAMRSFRRGFRGFDSQCYAVPLQGLAPVLPG